MNTKNKILSIWVVCGLFILIMYVFAKNEKDENKIQNQENKIDEMIPQNKQGGQQPYIEVTASKLIKSYKENEISADENYKNRWVKMSGYIESINKDFRDNPYMVITNGDPYSIINVHCDFIDASTLRHLKSGNKTTVFGKVRGLTLMSVFLDDCGLAEP
jgi:hypothetical protein